ncbi:Universal stress protein [Vigna angularis]|uniref:Universal stress protein n=1 Tax=Phaseolus angularis TaxID=3914 RepID=A0A8T0KB10_PHAAN|nr:Universal stress protein [Vigna angularis]
MQPYQNPPALDSDPQLPQIKIHHPSSPRHPSPAAATPTPTAGARRKIGVAVDLSDESAYAVRWAVQHYIRPGDAVILLHVSPTNVLFGADWGSIDLSINTDPNSDEEAVNAVNNNDHTTKRKLEDDFDAFTASKAADLAKPLREVQIPYKIHIVKDHDMKERLCLEVERLGLSAVIMGSRGFGAVRRGSDGRLGSVSDYCVHHCVCPVVVVRYPDDVAATAEAVVAVKEVDEGEAVIQSHKKDCCPIFFSRRDGRDGCQGSQDSLHVGMVDTALGVNSRGRYSPND